MNHLSGQHRHREPHRCDARTSCGRCWSATSRATSVHGRAAIARSSRPRNRGQQRISPDLAGVRARASASTRWRRPRGRLGSSTRRASARRSGVPLRIVTLFGGHAARDARRQRRQLGPSPRRSSSPATDDGRQRGADRLLAARRRACRRAVGFAMLAACRRRAPTPSASWRPRPGSSSGTTPSPAWLDRRDWSQQCLQPADRDVFAIDAIRSLNHRDGHQRRSSLSR